MTMRGSLWQWFFVVCAATHLWSVTSPMTLRAQSFSPGAVVRDGQSEHEVPSVLKRRSAATETPERTGAGLETSRRVATVPDELPSGAFADPSVLGSEATARSALRSVPARSVPAAPGSAERVALRAETPAIRVDVAGPAAVVLGKPTRIEVTASNDGTQPARDLTITLGLPAGVELGRVTAAAGRAQAAVEGGINWQLAALGPDERAVLELEVIPRQDSPISVTVDWVVRGTAATTLRVVRPALQLAIQGPEEILYGTRQTYLITVTNPGTGPAENVVLDVSSDGAGQSKNLGTIPPGGQHQVRMELVARDAGQLEIRAVASAEGLRQEAVHRVTVRRPELAVSVQGPGFAYAGASGSYRVQIANVGTATATDVDVTIKLPAGAKYTGGIQGAEESAGRLHWRLRDLAAQDQRTYVFEVRFEKPADTQCEVLAALPGEVASTATCPTRVEAVADLKLEVIDPQGPQAVGRDALYEIRIKNRGSKAASNVQVLGQFAHGIEPQRADGAPAEVLPGQVVFAPIATIEPGQTVTLKIVARAESPGNHRFRATLRARDPEVELIAEDVTAYFGGPVSAGGSGK